MICISQWKHSILPSFHVLCSCQPKWKWNTHTAIILREDSSEFYDCPSDFSTQTGTAFSQEILTVSTWNFQLLRFTIMGFIQNLWAESYHAFLLTGWWLLLYRQRNTGRSHKGIWKGTDKRITLLKTHCPVTAKRTCKVSDLTSPLLYHSDVGCVHSVKGLPYGVSASPCSLTSLRFLFSWHNKARTNFLQSYRLSFFHILYQFFYSTIQVTAQFTD